MVKAEGLGCGGGRWRRGFGRVVWRGGGDGEEERAGSDAGNDRAFIAVPDSGSDIDEEQGEPQCHEGGSNSLGGASGFCEDEVGVERVPTHEDGGEASGKDTAGDGGSGFCVDGNGDGVAPCGEVEPFLAERVVPCDEGDFEGPEGDPCDGEEDSSRAAFEVAVEGSDGVGEGDADGERDEASAEVGESFVVRLEALELGMPLAEALFPWEVGEFEGETAGGFGIGVDRLGGTEAQENGAEGEEGEGEFVEVGHGRVDAGGQHSGYDRRSGGFVQKLIGWRGGEGGEN